ncbi:MAG: hypothetical protein M1144_01805 [Candidatus Thermoplasmatota archaeon]|jgi:hypothetical protein|nr:hypothetical protein [Candidatus Thermoplasmatota archaeon]MCL5984697.1 hypothetical protein [Candidatus Thermoplasmatota archaeon]
MAPRLSPGDEWLESALLSTTTRVLSHYPELRSDAFEVRLSDARRVAGYFRAFGDPKRRPVIYITRRTVRGDPISLGKTLAHELGHLLQSVDRRWPDGERACDLIWLARCGAEFPRPPFYLNVGAARKEWPIYALSAQALAREAWERRAQGHRNYISWWERRIQQEAA